jgi:hypothetical protein
MASRAARRLVWRGHVEALVASGLSREDFCARQGLSRSTLYRWEQRLRGELGKGRALVVAEAVAFVPLCAAPLAQTVPLVLHVGGGMRLELPHDTDVAWLARLLRSLAGC